jgi:hypothetical protein
MRIILYILFIILIIRFIRSLFSTRIVIHKFDSRHDRDSFGQNKRKEGDITIIEPGKTSRDGKSGEPGDYVDYEEIK